MCVKEFRMTVDPQIVPRLPLIKLECVHIQVVPISLQALGGTKQISALDLEFSFYDTFRLIGSTFIRLHLAIDFM